jgi:hypothetical protein
MGVAAAPAIIGAAGDALGKTMEGIGSIIHASNEWTFPPFPWGENLELDYMENQNKLAAQANEDALHMNFLASLFSRSLPQADQDNFNSAMDEWRLAKADYVSAYGHKVRARRAKELKAMVAAVQTVGAIPTPTLAKLNSVAHTNLRMVAKSQTAYMLRNVALEEKDEMVRMYGSMKNYAAALTRTDPLALRDTHGFSLINLCKNAVKGATIAINGVKTAKKAYDDIAPWVQSIKKNWSKK